MIAANETAFTFPGRSTTIVDDNWREFHCDLHSHSFIPMHHRPRYRVFWRIICMYMYIYKYKQEIFVFHFALYFIRFYFLCFFFHKKTVFFGQLIFTESRAINGKINVRADKKQSNSVRLQKTESRFRFAVCFPIIILSSTKRARIHL